MDIRFQHLAYLHLLWVVLALLGVIVYGMARRRRALARFAHENVLARLLPAGTRARRWVKSSILLAALVALVMAIIDPRWGVYWEEVPSHGIDIVFVLDVSRSMLAEDVAPSRLERARQDIKDVVDTLAGDRVGLVTFAGVASLRCPLTTNYSSFVMALDEVEPSGAARGGSLLGDAIRIAAGAFVDQVKQYKTIIVLSDGEDQGSFPIEAARKVQEERGIRVFTVGVGDSAQGSRIPITRDGQKLYLQYEGQEVWTKMDPAILQQMALAGGGAFIPAGTSRIDLGQIYQQKIAGTEKREFETSRVQRYKVRYQWFAGLALLLVMVETMIREARPGWSSRRESDLLLR